MTVYFKATREDGTDFHSGKIPYEVGRTVRPAKMAPGVKPALCQAGYLHAADVPAETLVGGWWPCRLFEVTGKPHAGFAGPYPHKGGFRQLRVLREIDPHLALGPNGREVAAIIARAKKLTFAETADLLVARDAAWDAASDAAWDAAWDAARGAARGGAWSAVMDVAWDAASATLTRDLITPTQFDCLYGPWATVIDAKDRV